MNKIGMPLICIMALASGSSLAADPPQMAQRFIPAGKWTCQLLINSPTGNGGVADSDLSAYDNYTGKLVYRLRRGQPWPKEKCVNALDGHTLRVDGNPDVIGRGDVP